MYLILILVAAVLGPVLYSKGKSSQNINLKVFGLLLWLIGWGYMVYVVIGLAGFARG